jgi:hypothetical protein
MKVTVKKEGDFFPSVSITSPSNGANVSGKVTISANAYDDKGISKVEFYVNNNLKGTVTSSPYNYEWDTTGLSGSFTIKAKAFDTINQTAEDSITVTVSSRIPPTITTHPKSQTINSNQTATISVEATGSAPFSYQWYTGSTGNTSNPIGGATSESYTTPPLTSTSSFWVRVSNEAGHADSNTAIISIGLPSQMEGTVFDKATSAAIAGATVNLGTYPSVTTDQNGRYTISNLAGGNYQVIVSRAGYNTHSENIDVPKNGTFTRNFYLSSPTGEIKVTSLTSKYNGFLYYIAGTDFNVTYTAQVDWSNHPPGKVRFITPKGSYDIQTTGDTASKDFNIGFEFSPCTTLKALAISSDNSQSKELSADFTVMSPILGGLVFKGIDIGDGFIYHTTQGFDFTLIDELIDENKIPENIPLFGKKGFNLRFVPTVDVTAESSGQVDIELDWESKALYEKKWTTGKMAGFEFSLTPSLNLGGQYLHPDCQYKWTGSFGLNGHIEKSQSWPFLFWAGPIPMPMYAKVAFTFDADASLGIENINPKKLNGQFSLEPYVRGSLGAGFDQILAIEGWIGGGANFEFQYPQTPNLKDITIYLNGGVSVYAFLWKWEKEALRWDWELIKSSLQTFSSDFELPTMPRLISREYLNNPDSGKFFKLSSFSLKTITEKEKTYSIESAILQNSVFPYSEPSLSSSSNLIGLTWVQDNANRTAINRTMAVFSTYDGATWSTPKSLSDEGTADFHPQNLIFSDGNAIAAWEDEKIVFPDTATFDDMVKNLEISVSTYNGSTRTWSTANRFTSNFYLDRSPQLSGKSMSNVMLVWIENESNDLRGNANALNKIWYSIFNGSNWSVPQLATQIPFGILKYSLVYDGNKAYLVFSIDTDNDQTTVADHELYSLAYNNADWGSLVRLTEDTLPDDNPKISIDSNGNIVLVWVKGNELTYSLNFDVSNRKTILTEEYSTNLADFKLASSGSGKFCIIWAEPSNYSSDIYTIFYDPILKEWGRSTKQVTFDPETERNLSAAFLGDNSLVAVYNKNQIGQTAQTRTAANGEIVSITVPSILNTDLCIIKYTMGRDLALKQSSFTASPQNPEPGMGVTFTVTALNVGDEAASNIPVAFYSGDPGNGGTKIGEAFISGNFNPGEADDVSFAWEVPQISNAIKVYAVIDPNSAFDTANRTNNVANIEMVKPDLRISGVRWERLLNNKILIIARVVNDGAITSEQTTIRFRKETKTGALLNEQNIPSLSKSAFEDTTFEWDVSDLPVQDYIIYIVVDEKNLVPEFNKDNNTRVVTIRYSTWLSLTVTSPNGGESWEVGTAHNITWTTIGTASNIKVEYSTNGGISWTEVITSTSDTGSYSWTIPNTPSSNCKVKLTAYYDSGSSTTDESDGNFSIVPPGQLQVVINPQEAIDAGAQWKIKTEENWHNGGETVSYSPAGSYTLEFKAISGWSKPPDKSITITVGQTTYESGTYEKIVFITDKESVIILEGGTASFQIKLSAQPSSDLSVIVSRVSGDSDISVQSGSSLTFTTANWNTYQTVTLAAAEDADTTNGQATIRISASGIPDKDITAIEGDNDTLNLVTDTDEVSVPEGGTASFQIKLSAQPSSDLSVMVSRVSGDSDISVQSGSSLTFTTANWNTYQVVTLAAAEDADTTNGKATICISASEIPNKDITAIEEDNNLSGGNISLSLNPTMGTSGNTITVSIDISNNTQQISAFGLELIYNSTSFVFKGVKEGSLTSDWSPIEGNEIDSGKIRIGGYAGGGTVISPSSDGSLVEINLQVKEDLPYDEDTTVQFKIEGYVDDIARFLPNPCTKDFMLIRLGDVNADGEVTPGDAQLAFEIYLGKITPTLRQTIAADFNRNGRVTPEDAQLIFEHYLGKRVLAECRAGDDGQRSIFAINMFRPAKRMLYALNTIGNSGEIISVPIIINNPEGVRSFSFEVNYNPELLEYIGLRMSPLTSEFDYVRGIKEGEGLISIEGESKRPIRYNKYGSAAVMVFRVKEGINGSLPIIVSNLSEDLFNVEAGEGTFIALNYSKKETRFLSLGEAYIALDGTLRIPVEVSNAFNMKSFGLELKYSAKKLLFMGIARGAMTDDFLEVEGNELKAGIVRIGGYSMSGIQEEGAGVLVELVFYMKENGGEVEIVKLVDDIQDFLISKKSIKINK